MLGKTKEVELDFSLVRNTRYPEFIPNYDQVQVLGFEVEGEILRTDFGMDFISFLGSPVGLSVKTDIHFDLVDCKGVPDTNIPCHYGRK